MKSRLLCFALFLAALSSVACKKDDDSSATIKPSLYGATFSIAPFGAVGQSFTLKAGGEIAASNGDNLAKNEVGFYWQVDDGKRDTVNTYTFTPTETGNFTVNLVAFSRSSSYYSSTASKVISIIDPALGKSLNGTGIEAEDQHISAEGVDYYYKQIAGKDWFRNNLANPNSGLCYADAAVTATVLGKFYSWEEANAACPEGWRLPSADEFKALADAFEGNAGALMVNASFNGKRMWAYTPGVEIDNASGFSAIPSGYVSKGSGNSYNGLNEYAAFWTSTAAEDDAEMAVYYYLNVNQSEIFSQKADKQSLALSVRCVR